MTKTPEATSILGVAVRDLARLRFVATTVARHGFGEVVSRSPLGRRLFTDTDVPEQDADLRSSPAAVRFRKLLEALGPTWIKLGQILSSRVDLLPRDYLVELEALQDDAPVLTAAVVRRAVEEGLGRSVDEAFATFDEEPLATASIAQTHVATTHEGQPVVVKVQRPGIEHEMRGDLDLLYLAAKVLEATIDEMEVYRPSEIVMAFERDLVRELDFHHERANLVLAAHNLDPERRVSVPEPVDALSSRTVLTMTRFEGRPLRSLTPSSPMAKAAVEEILHVGCKQVFLDGFFHADPHPGNILVGDDGRLCMIDLGLAGRMTAQQREDVVTLVLAAIVGDVNTLARILLKIGTPRQRIHMASFKAEISKVRSEHLEVDALGEVDSSAFVQAFVDAAQRYRIQLNASYSLMVKAAITLEGVIRSLHPEAPVVAIARPYVDQVVRERMTPQRVLTEALTGVTGVGSLVRELPGHLDQVLHDVETGNLMVRPVTPELDRVPRQLHQAGSRLALALFSATMSVCAALLLPNDPTTLLGVPWLSLVLIVLAVIGWTVSWWWHFVGTGQRIRVGPVLQFLQRALPDTNQK